MARRGRGVGHGHAGPARLTAPVAAFGVYALALGTGAAPGLFALQDRGAAVPVLASVASDWQVTDGTLALTVTQFGSPVTGAFADWTAAIAFDPVAPAGETPVGSVTTTVSIASLTLGSVTSGATGPNFLAADTFVTALFRADLLRTDAGYVAQGTLTLRDVTRPLTFPFDLTVDGDTATASAVIALNRLDFGVGETMPDESTVAFAVDIAVDLTANRAAE